MKRLTVGIIVALVVGAAVIAGLVFMNGKNSSDKGMDMPAKSSSSQTSKPEETNSVTIENFAFSSDDITVKKGTTVTWTNKDSAAHTVTADDGNGPNSQTLAQGDSYSFKFDKAGTFKYHCQIHSSMTGTVTVE